jgi:hypothetical protein
MGKGYIGEIDSMSNKLLYVIIICGFILLFSPEKVLVSLGLMDFSTHYKPFIGATTLTAIVFAVVRFFYFLAPKISGSFNRRHNRNKVKRYMKCLNKDDKSFLMAIYKNKHKVIGVHPLDSSAMRLQSYGIIDFAPDFITSNLEMAYMPDIGNIEYFILSDFGNRFLPEELKS